MKLLQLVNEIKVVPNSLRFFKISIEMEDHGEENSFYLTNEVDQEINYQQLQSDLNTYSNHGEIIICKGDGKKNVKRRLRIILCLPTIGDAYPDSNLPSGFDREIRTLAYSGFAYVSGVFALDAGLDSISNEDLADMIYNDDFLSESGISPQQALQYLKGISI